MNCHHCNSVKLRNSRFRLEDLIHLLKLQTPVRCRDCKMREYVSFPKALAVARAEKARRSAALADQSKLAP
jgi:hypothetical protein